MQHAIRQAYVADFPGEIEAHHVWLATERHDVIGVFVRYKNEHGFYLDTVAVSPG
jgi:hypothetical protein